MQKRSLSLHGHRTSLALEPEFWDETEKAVTESGLSFAAFITQLDDQRITERARQNLASYLRVWVVKRLQSS